jgi:D-alanyl-lipoteichoic acid acyltransferase DltB (MBOAT superfamily)
VTFALSGLWHGANWTYVVWGVLNGVYLIAGIMTNPLRDRGYQLLGIKRNGVVRTFIAVGTTFALTCCGWVIFRAESLSDAWYIFGHFWRGWDINELRTEQFALRQMPAAVLSIVFLEAVQWLHGRRPLPKLIAEYPLAVRWPVYVGFVLAVVLLGVYRQNQFIYFQF